MILVADASALIALAACDSLVLLDMQNYGFWMHLPMLTVLDLAGE